jgi:hypothetical protein
MLNNISRMISRRALASEITVVLVIKIILIWLAAVFLFGSDHHLPIDGNMVAQRIFGQDTFP